jgi:ATP-binding cassette subfamily C protein CydD
LDIIDAAEQSDGQAMPDTAVAIPQFAQGAITLIHGPSGSGKTSLLNQLRASLGRDAVSWLPQNVGLMPGSVKENIVGFEVTDVHQQNLMLAIEYACLDDLDLNQTVGQATMKVSGGQAQRIGLARTFYRALSQETPWVLLDEPISALDRERTQKVSESLKHLTTLGATVVAVSHQSLPNADFKVLITNA